MRCIVIDVESREVKEAQIPETADSGVSFIQGVVGGHFASAGIVKGHPRGEGEDVLFVDDEGLLKEKAGSFAFAGMNHPTPLGFEGSGIVVGIDRVGETVGAKVPLDEVRRMVQFTRP